MCVRESATPAAPTQVLRKTVHVQHLDEESGHITEKLKQKANTCRAEKALIKKKALEDDAGKCEKLVRFFKTVLG